MSTGREGGTGVFFILRHGPAVGMLEVGGHGRVVSRLGRRVPSLWVGSGLAGELRRECEKQNGCGATRVSGAKGTGVSFPIDGHAKTRLVRPEDRIVGLRCGTKETPVPHPTSRTAAIVSG